MRASGIAEKRAAKRISNQERSDAVRISGAVPDNGGTTGAHRRSSGMADEVLRFLTLLRTNDVVDQRATQILLRYRQNETAIKNNKSKRLSKADEPSGRNLPTARAEAVAKTNPEGDYARDQAQIT